MMQPERLWKRLSGFATSNRGGFKSKSPSAGGSGDANEAPNPWLLLHQNAGRSQADAGGSTRAQLPIVTALSGRSGAMPPITEAESVAAGHPRWVSEGASPYGFSDDDGTLRQTETGNWRRAFGERPFESDAHERNARFHTRTHASRPRPRSTWFLQAIAAAVMVVGGLYAVHNHSSVALEARGVYQSAFEKDDSSTVGLATVQFLSAHHIHVPAFASNFGAIQLHPPIQGTILQDYTSSQPEMTLVGKPAQHVLAVGSGTVTRVSTVKGGAFIEIDHGSLGTSWYSGVSKPTVHLHEYVTAGEVIGSLPTTSKHPELQFAMEKNNQFENPHDFIHFPSQAN